MKFKAALIAAFAMLCLPGAGASANDIAKNQCAACHGPDGNSINPEWPNLAGQHAKYINQQLRAYKSGDRVNPNMSAMVTTLTDKDIVAIGDYYSTMSPKIGRISADNIAAGEKLYRGGDKDNGLPACMACHGPNGAGNPAANYPALRGQHAQYTSIQLAAYRSGERKTGTERKAMMQTIAAKLSDEDIANLASYINALH
ncbi:MAG: c-type cytochrome [Gammaproteobacteria bacterium]|jgi:cytochrome c553